MNSPISNDELLGRPVVLVVALALVSLAPFVFMSVTSFVKISTVLQILRGAIGAQGVPSGTVVMALSATLTLLVMAPVGNKIAARTGRLVPLFGPPHGQSDTSTLVQDAVDAVREPLHEFIQHNASETEKTRFLAIAKEARRAEDRVHVQADDWTVLVPAFVITELTNAFKIGFLIYLPFLVIDLVIANILLALGMQMLNPTQLSLPFKLLLFVAVDGWGLLARALVVGYS